MATSFATSGIKSTIENEKDQIGEHWVWALITGLLLAALGGFALAMPVTSSIGLTFAIGVLLTFSGVIQLIHAIRMWKHRGEGLRFLQAFLALAGGGLIFRYPESGMLGVALVLSFYFLIAGAMQGMLFMSLRKSQTSRLWILLGSVSSFIIGVYVIATFPFSALWVPGLLVGIDLIFAGVSLIGFSLTSRDHRKSTPTASMNLKPTTGVL